MTTCIYKTAEGYCCLHSDFPDFMEPCAEGPCDDEALWIISQVSLHEAIKIIALRGRKGLFWAIDGDRYIGIDNTDGNAWTENFDSLEACIRWLERKEMQRDAKI